MALTLSLGGCGQESPPTNLPDLAPTPPMGWNSWNSFGTAVSDKLVRQVADAMAANGMQAAGYRYINLDDGWALPKRIQGHLQPDPVKFPQGLKPLADYLHARGFKFGLYADRGLSTCGAGSPGSHGHEAIDAADFAAWGVDYLKYDNCDPAFFSTQEGDYRRMAEALQTTGRPIVLSLCAWKFKSWMPRTGQLWRTTGDITDDWDRVTAILDENERSAAFAGPGHWNDPDMLVVGCWGVGDIQNDRDLDGKSELAGAKGLSDGEARAHFSLWAMMAAPLIAGNDVRRMKGNIRDILTNREVIAVDQDPLGRQGVKVSDDSQGTCIYSKVLSGQGARAVVLFNRSAQDRPIEVKWSDLGLPDASASVRDLWAHQDLGAHSAGYRAYVPSHGVVMLKVTARP